jgi:hypothetical protein
MVLLSQRIFKDLGRSSDISTPEKVTEEKPVLGSIRPMARETTR